MKTIENIYKFNTRNFSTRVDAIEEPFPDLSFDETGEVIEKLESGEYVVFCAHVTVSFKGMVLSEEFLGNCIYETPAEFRDHIGSKCKGYGSYFSDMVRTSIQNARKSVSCMPKLRK
jgi:hypothetical protein